MDYLFHVLVLITIFSILSSSLNLIVGYTGLLSISHAAFFGLGAYTWALMSLAWDTPFFVGVLGAAVLCGILGILVGLPSLRVHNDYFAIATFSFQIILYTVFNNWVGLTQGSRGLSGLPAPSIGRVDLDEGWQMLVLSGALALLTLVILRRIVHSPLGRVLRGIREDERLTMVAGKDVFRFKLLAFTMGGILAGIAGAVFASHQRSIDPASFTVMDSILIISMVIVGGAGSLRGPVVGAILLVVLPEVLRFLGLPGTISANVRQIVYGLLLVAFMIWRPLGLFGRFSFDRRSQPL